MWTLRALTSTCQCESRQSRGQCHQWRASGSVSSLRTSRGAWKHSSAVWMWALTLSSPTPLTYRNASWWFAACSGQSSATCAPCHGMSDRRRQLRYLVSWVHPVVWRYCRYLLKCEPSPITLTEVDATLAMATSQVLFDVQTMQDMQVSCRLYYHITLQ